MQTTLSAGVRAALAALTFFGRGPEQGRVQSRLRVAVMLTSGALGFGIDSSAILAAENGVEKVKEFGTWSMYCEKDNAGKCALVQAVHGGAGSDPRAWVQASVQPDDSGSLTFKFRVDRSVRLEPGVGVRIDDKQVGIAVPFRCEETYCEAGLSVSNATQPNEFGVELLTGKKIEFDVLFAEAMGVSGYRVPLNLSSLKDGVAELTSRQYQQDVASVAIPNSGPNSAKHLWGFLAGKGVNEDIVLRVEPTSWQVWDGETKSGAGYSASGRWSNDLTAKYTTSCTVRNRSGGQSVLSADVTIGNDLALPNDDQRRLRELIHDSKHCGAARLFVISDATDDDLERQQGVSAFELTAKKLSLARVLQDEGVPKDHIVSGSRDGKLLLYLPSSAGPH